MLLKLVIENSDTLSEDDIIDEILDLLVAGTEATQYVSSHCIAHFITDSKSLKRARTEFE